MMRDCKVEKADLVKVVFEIQGESVCHTESLWARPEGDGRYRLCNSPFYAFGVSFEDVVFARDVDGLLMFTGVAATSGHSTYRLSLNDVDRELLEAALANLNSLGCTYEQGPYLALDVPPESDIHRVYALLEEGEARGLWEFEEGHCGHPSVTASGSPAAR
jgi:hypothetical protein